VKGPSPPPVRGGGLATTVLFGAAACFLGLLGGLPLLLGPVVGALGVFASTAWRTHGKGRGGTVALVPALLALAILAGTSPVAPSTDLFAGLAGLAFLLWIADDPARPAGGGRRAMPTIAPAALGVGLAWAITLALVGQPEEVGLAGGLLAAALVLLAFLVSGLPRRAPAHPRNAQPVRGASPHDGV